MIPLRELLKIFGSVPAEVIVILKYLNFKILSEY